MRGAKIKAGGMPCLIGLLPPQRAEAPPITCTETREAVLWHWRHKVIARRDRKIQKGLSHLGTHGMHAVIERPGMAVTVAKEAGHRILATQLDG